MKCFFQDGRVWLECNVEDRGRDRDREQMTDDDFKTILYFRRPGETENGK
jgi:hypothetical protein